MRFPGALLEQLEYHKMALVYNMETWKISLLEI